jgi:hypothetical protein
MRDSVWTEAAAWVEALGAIGAVVGAAWVAANESRASRRREDRALQEAEHREHRALLATRTAALNLGILAVTQIHDLHILLQDEAWRGRVTRVSPSLTLLTTERMLTAFPIQSLGDAEAMVAFSRFPSALATAAEVYANLESAVRAAGPADQATIFVQYAGQMERIDATVRRGLSDLRRALHLDADSASGAEPLSGHWVQGMDYGPQPEPYVPPVAPPPSGNA